MSDSYTLIDPAAFQKYCGAIADRKVHAATVQAMLAGQKLRAESRAAETTKERRALAQSAAVWEELDRQAQSLQAQMIWERTQEEEKEKSL